MKPPSAGSLRDDLLGLLAQLRPDRVDGWRRWPAGLICDVLAMLSPRAAGRAARVLCLPAGNEARNGQVNPKRTRGLRSPQGS